MKPITIKDAEITICGLTFIVDYNYFAGCPATWYTPADPAEVDFLRVKVKGQPEANADELLEAIKIYMSPTLNNGYFLLQQHIIKFPPL